MTIKITGTKERKIRITKKRGSAGTGVSRLTESEFREHLRRACYSDLHELFCRKLRRLRVRAGMRQTDLAERLGLGRVRVTELENGRYEPTLSVLEAVAEAFDVDPRVFLGRPRNYVPRANKPPKHRQTDHTGVRGIRKDPNAT